MSLMSVGPLSETPILSYLKYRLYMQTPRKYWLDQFSLKLFKEISFHNSLTSKIIEFTVQCSNLIIILVEGYLEWRDYVEKFS